MKNSIKTAVIWGVVLGAGLSALELLKMLARRVDYPFGSIADLMMILLFIVVLVKGIKTYRDSVKGGFISFGKAFGMGMGIVVVAFLFFLLYLVLHFSFIEKDGIDRLNLSFEQKYRSRVEQDTITGNDMNMYIISSKDILNDAKKSVLNDDTLCNSFIDKELEELHYYFSERLQRGRATDTANYRYCNFCSYAKGVLMNTCEQILNENANDTLCTEKFSNIVMTASTALDTVNPLKLRLETEKDKIPHYSNSLTVAMMNSLMVLMYGLFLNIFTSLYIYRKKENSCGAAGEDMPQETPEK